MGSKATAADDPAWGVVRPYGPSQDEEAPFEASDHLSPGRNPGERDADRILYAPEFRRLAGVTQVISPQTDFVFHDRLTHSLKVAQVATRLAQDLRRQFIREHTPFDPRGILLDPAVCYTAALAHDLGHPPFGHAAEVALQGILTESLGTDPHNEALLPDSFEGNAQTFRIVSKLSFRKPPEDGLNLSWRTLAAISKYPWSYSDPRANKDGHLKWSYYSTEEPYEKQLLISGLIHPHGSDDEILQSLEAQVMDWADDIAYAVHDLDDFYRTGLIPLNLFRRTSKDPADDKNREWDEVREHGIRAVRKTVPTEDLPEAALTEIVKELRLVLSVEQFDGSAEAHEVLRDASSSLIQGLAAECYVDIHPKSGKPFLQVTPAGRAKAAFLKSIMKFYVLGDSSVELMQVGQTRVVRELFTELWTIGKKHYVSGDDRRRRPLPARFQQYLTASLRRPEFNAYGGTERKLARATVDFMCTLTDRQASLLHQRLTGDSVGSLPSYWMRI